MHNPVIPYWWLIALLHSVSAASLNWGIQWHLFASVQEFMQAHRCTPFPLPA